MSTLKNQFEKFKIEIRNQNQIGAAGKVKQYWSQQYNLILQNVF